MVVVNATYCYLKKFQVVQAPYAVWNQDSNFEIRAAVQQGKQQCKAGCSYDTSSAASTEAVNYSLTGCKRQFKIRENATNKMYGCASLVAAR